MKNLNSLDTRVYKYRGKERVFFCPLCRTERNISVTPKLTKKNYVQMAITTLLFGLALMPFFGAGSFFVFFVIWAFFELAVRSSFKKQVPCPHCGFDATAYKKDVKVARQQVKDFWAQKQNVKQSN